MTSVIAKTVEAPEWVAAQGEIVAVEYRLGRLRIELCELGGKRMLEVIFANVDGFRVLDERDLSEFWPTCSSPNGSIFEVSEGGWLSQELQRSGFITAHMNGELKEYLVTGADDCVNVLSASPPEVRLLRGAQSK